MDNADVDRVAAWLVKAGLAGMLEHDLMRGFCEECRSIRLNPGKVFDLTLPLERVADRYRAMDERRAIKTLLRP